MDPRTVVADIAALSADDRKLAQRMLHVLIEEGPSKGNGDLRKRLRCDQQSFFRVRNTLHTHGLLVPGRGRGGSTRLAQEQTDPTPDSSPDDGSESALYGRILATLRNGWQLDRGFTLVKVAQTADYGKRGGGQWEHPDFVAGGFSVLPFEYGNQIDLYSFEAKRYGVAIQGLYEAVHHRRFVHYSYLLICEPGSDLNWDLLDSLAMEWGIGLIHAEEADNYEKWTERVAPQRNDPPPGRMNSFLARRVPEDFRTTWRNWLGHSPTAEKLGNV